MGNGITPISIIEDVFSATGLDKLVVHRITGGKRIMERDGRISPEFVQGLEKFCSDCGIDYAVHFATGGNRIVDENGAFIPEGIINCANSIATLVTDPTGQVAQARVWSALTKVLIDEFLNVLTELCKEAGGKASQILQLKSKLENFKRVVTTLSNFKLGDDVLKFADAVQQLPTIATTLAHLDADIANILES